MTIAMRAFVPPPIFRPILIGAGVAVVAGLLCGFGMKSTVADIMSRPREPWQLNSPRLPGAFEAWQPTEGAPPYFGRWTPPQDHTAADLAAMEARVQALLREEPPAAAIVQAQAQAALPGEGPDAELPDGPQSYMPSERGDILAASQSESADDYDAPRVHVVWGPDSGPYDDRQPYGAQTVDFRPGLP